MSHLSICAVHLQGVLCHPGITVWMTTTIALSYIPRLRVTNLHIAGKKTIARDILGRCAWAACAGHSGPSTDNHLQLFPRPSARVRLCIAA